MKDKIREWVEKNRKDLGLKDSSFSLNEMTNGESNHVYKVEAEEDILVKASEFIVRISLDISEDRIAHEAKMIDLLKEEGVRNVPEKILFDDSSAIGQPVLAETYIGEYDIGVKDMDRRQLETFAQKLAAVHSTGPESYNQIFGEDEPEQVSMEEELAGNFEQYSKEPFEQYRKKVDEVDPRVKRFFQKQKELYSRMIESDGRLPWKMTHGDPSNNVRASENNIYLIDWELARPGVPRFELIYMFRHNDMSQEEREEFLKIYRKYRETSEFADDHASRWEKFLAFNDMIWAAKRKEKVKEKGEDALKYEEMFEKRLTELENMWENQ